MAAPLGVTREGQGPALLLLHGIGSSRTAWDKQIERLRDAFTCIAPDLPGYGDSPAGNVPGLAAIVERVAAVLEGKPASVVGVSFGALVSLALARQEPSLVKSLILADATLGRAGDSVEERRRWLAHRHALANDLTARSLERAAEIAAPDAPRAIISDIAAHMRRARPEGYIAVAEAIAATDAEPWLGEINQPALVVCGEHDRVTGLRVSRTLAQNLPHARLMTMAGVGHAPHIEKPDDFAAHIRDFMNEGR